jgi:hypothetical protein
VSHYQNNSAKKSVSWKSFLPGFVVLILLFASGGFFVKTTLAANISLRSGSAIEFGQGVSRAYPCSENYGITVTPASEFVNATNAAGKHYFKSVTFTGIPISCIGVDFIVSAYSDSGATPLAIFNSTNTSAYVSMTPGPTFSPGFNSTGLTVQTNSSSGGFYSFTATFNSPAAESMNVAKVTVETGVRKNWPCAEGGPCAIDDLGPGGGTIFYRNLTGFNCGVLDNATGSPNGSLCNYLEIAPTGFNSSYSTVAVKTTASTLYPSNTAFVDLGLISSSEIGAGLKYNNDIIAANTRPANCNTLSTCTSAPFIPRLYSSKSLSDWYLPNISELNQLCKWLYNQPYTSDVTACGNSGSIKSGFTWPSPVIAVASNSKDATQFWGMVINPTGSTCSNKSIGTITQWSITNANGNGCSGFFPMAVRAF